MEVEELSRHQVVAVAPSLRYQAAVEGLRCLVLVLGPRWGRVLLE